MTGVLHSLNASGLQPSLHAVSSTLEPLLPSTATLGGYTTKSGKWCRFKFVRDGLILDWLALPAGSCLAFSFAHARARAGALLLFLVLEGSAIWQHADALPLQEMLDPL